MKSHIAACLFPALVFGLGVPPALAEDASLAPGRPAGVHQAAMGSATAPVFAGVVVAAILAVCLGSAASGGSAPATTS